MDAKVAVIGDADFVMPFSALGLDTYCVDDSTEQIGEAARQIVKQGYGLVVVAENIAATADETFAECQDRPTPCVVVVPFTTEAGGFATEVLAEVLRMATGIDILQGE